jgi:hypothetical protein
VRHGAPLLLLPLVPASKQQRVVDDPGMADLGNAKAILTKMLERDFDEAAIYRRQLAVADLVRPDTGCSINVDRARAARGLYDESVKGDVLAEARGHGRLWIMLHVYEGYLDDLELVNHARFPDPATVRVLNR